jgi:hypothetical protein
MVADDADDQDGPFFCNDIDDSLKGAQANGMAGVFYPFS